MDHKNGALIFAVVLFAARAVSVVHGEPAPVGSPSPYSVQAPTVVVSTYTWRTVPNVSLPKFEDLTYVVKWGLVTAGYSTLSIKGIERVNGRPTYHLVSQAKS